MSDPSFSRRDLISAAAGIAFVNHAVADEKTPGTQVGDRTSSIRITAMKTYWVGPIVYVKIETNHGISGWGDLKGVDPHVSKPLAESLFELLDGENPTRIEHLWQKLFRSHRNIRGGALMVHTLAAIDMALWDITGERDRTIWGMIPYLQEGCIDILQPDCCHSRENNVASPECPEANPSEATN